MKRALPSCLFALLAAACLAPGAALALSYCASDGQKAPKALLERFISADCEACWADPKTQVPARDALALDWVLPGAKGDDAPLSAVATRDASDRLQSLGRTLGGDRLASTSIVAPPSALKLRVAHGLPVNDYVGTSIEAKPGTALRRQATMWLLLVETIPAGTEGSPVERNLVRNALMSAWNGAAVLSKTEQKRFYESRPMRMPEGARAERLRVVGFVQDDKGRVLAAAASRCSPAK